MDNTLVAQLNQAAINGIRAAGAKSQYIFVVGNSYTGAWTWVGCPLAAVCSCSRQLLSLLMGGCCSNVETGLFRHWNSPSLSY